MEGAALTGSPVQLEDSTLTPRKPSCGSSVPIAPLSFLAPQDGGVRYWKLQYRKLNPAIFRPRNRISKPLPLVLSLTSKVQEMSERGVVKKGFVDSRHEDRTDMV